MSGSEDVDMTRNIAIEKAEEDLADAMERLQLAKVIRRKELIDKKIECDRQVHQKAMETIEKDAKSQKDAHDRLQKKITDNTATADAALEKDPIFRGFFTDEDLVSGEDEWKRRMECARKRRRAQAASGTSTSYGA